MSMQTKLLIRIKIANFNLFSSRHMFSNSQNPPISINVILYKHGNQNSVKLQLVVFITSKKVFSLRSRGLSIKRTIHDNNSEFFQRYHRYVRKISVHNFLLKF